MAFDVLTKRAIRGPVNEMDKSTVVSILPLKIKEVKLTIQPGLFELAKGTFDNPSILVVGPSSYWMEPHIDQPLIEIQVGSLQIAESIVKDFYNGLIGCNMQDSIPGLFFVQGAKNVAQIKKDHSKELELARTKQRNWYMELIKMADAFWAKSNGNPIVISDLMKIAAEEMQVKENKAWMKDFSTIELKNCPACGTLLNPAFPMCANCKTIVDHKKFAELGLKVAV